MCTHVFTFLHRHWHINLGPVKCNEALTAIFVVMMAASNWNLFRVTGPLLRGIPRSPVNSPHKGQWRGALMFSLICAWTNSLVNTRGYLRRHRAHYDVIVMVTALSFALPGGVLGGRSEEGRLLQVLFTDYNPSARPVINSSKTATVAIQFSLLHIKDLVSHPVFTQHEGDVTWG